jgi:hypothetical protein
MTEVYFVKDGVFPLRNELLIRDCCTHGPKGDHRGDDQDLKGMYHQAILNLLLVNALRDDIECSFSTCEYFNYRDRNYCLVSNINAITCKTRELLRYLDKNSQRRFTVDDFISFPIFKWRGLTAFVKYNSSRAIDIEDTVCYVYLELLPFILKTIDSYVSPIYFCQPLLSSVLLSKIVPDPLVNSHEMVLAMENYPFCSRYIDSVLASDIVDFVIQSGLDENIEHLKNQILTWDTFRLSYFFIPMYCIYREQFQLDYDIFCNTKLEEQMRFFSPHYGTTSLFNRCVQHIERICIRRIYFGKNMTIRRCLLLTLLSLDSNARRVIRDSIKEQMEPILNLSSLVYYERIRDME